jgi:hypothetical protein
VRFTLTPLSQHTHRYDARLLLDALPTLTTDSPTSPTISRNNEPSPHAQRPDSPGGWSDLPSDSEDTFFLTPSETADLHRTKRLRHLDDLRTARLRALSPDDNDDNNNAENGGGDHDPWGGSDEEPPDETQIELMRRTASHVVRATNDAQLRARILAHHGADPRFAFLRGRWARAWVRAQADARREVFAEREVQNAGALGGLTGYGSGSGSESEDGTGGGASEEEGTEHALPVRMGAVQDARDEAVRGEAEPTVRAVQEARRAKAREWAEKRRAAKALAMADSDSVTGMNSN